MAQLARYAMVSVIATVTTLTVLGGLVATRALTVGWANVVAYAIGTVPSFVLNRRWVWRQTGRPTLSTEILPYGLFNLISLAVSTIAVSYAGRWADQAGRTGPVRTLVVLGTDLAVFGSLWLIQFVLCRTLFRRGVSTTNTTADPGPGFGISGRAAPGRARR
jgi:putative flippase GtrA